MFMSESDKNTEIRKISANLIEKFKKKYNQQITPFYLQKSLWFFYLGTRNKNFEINDNELIFETWLYGPVIPFIWREFRHHPEQLESNHGEITIEEEKIIIEIITKILSININELTEETHHLVEYMNENVKRDCNIYYNENIEIKYNINYFKQQEEWFYDKK